MKTSTNLQKNNTTNLPNAIDYTFDQKLFNINTIMACVFNEYIEINGIKYGVVTQLISNLDANNNPLPKPIQFNVPIAYIMGGNAGINIEYVSGDLVVVAYNQRTLIDLKIAWENGHLNITDIYPSNYGKFTIEDGIILGKISPIIPSIVINITNNGIDINSNNTPININSGTNDVSVTCKNANIISSNNISINANSTIEETASTINLNGNINLNGIVTCTSSLSSVSLTVGGKDFLTHVHSGVTSGTSNTGTVV